jgi:hypothetical protein
MDYSLRCACGRTIPVTEGLAGAKVSCVCGRELAVPSSLELRAQAGLPPVPPDPLLVVEDMWERGELPLSQCVVCGDAGARVIDLAVLCEQSWARTLSHESEYSVFLPWWLRSFSRQVEVVRHGRDRRAVIPATVCQGCASRIAVNRFPLALRILRNALPVAGVVVGLVEQSWGAAAALIAAALPAWGLERFVAVTQRSETRAALLKVPEFAAVLQKYPEAEMIRLAVYELDEG